MIRVKLAWALVLVLVMGGLLWAGEEITVTTYYPSPRGVYDQLQANRIDDFGAIGTYFLDPNASSQLAIVNVNALTIDPGDLTVAGNLTVTGATNLGSTLTVAGAASLGSTLDVAGAANLNGGLTAPTGTITSLNGTDLTYGTGAITSLSGTDLTYGTGAITSLSGNALTYNTGAIATLSGTGLTYDSGTFNTLTTNALNVSQLNVSDFVQVRGGAVRLDSDVRTLNTVFTNNVVANGNVQGGSLNIANAATVGSLTAAGNISGASLNITGTATINTLDAATATIGDLTVDFLRDLGNLQVDGALTVGGATSLSSSLNVAGATALSSGLTVSGAASLNGGLSAPTGSIGDLAGTSLNYGSGTIGTLAGTSLNYGSGTIGTLAGTSLNYGSGTIGALSGTSLNYGSGTIGTLAGTSLNYGSGTIGTLGGTSLTYDSGTFNTLTINSDLYVPRLHASDYVDVRGGAVMLTSDVTTVGNVYATDVNASGIIGTNGSIYAAFAIAGNTLDIASAANIQTLYVTGNMTVDGNATVSGNLKAPGGVNANPNAVTAAFLNSTGGAAIAQGLNVGGYTTMQGGFNSIGPSVTSNLTVWGALNVNGSLSAGSGSFGSLTVGGVPVTPSAYALTSHDHAGVYEPEGCSACPSDLRLKTDLMPLTHALDKLVAIQPVSFRWNEEFQKQTGANGDRQLGVVAQEVEPAFPELISTVQIGEADYKAVDYGKLSAVLIEAVKELKAEQDALKGLVCTDHPEGPVCRSQ